MQFASNDSIHTSHKNMKNHSLAFIIATTIITLITSCSKKDQDTITPMTLKPTVIAPGDTTKYVPRDTIAPVISGTAPKDTVTNFFVYFTNPIDSRVEVGAYEDMDGSGPQQGTIGGVSLAANTTYLVTFRIEDATNHQLNRVYIHDKIKANAKDFRICIDNPLGILSHPTDSDGTYAVGLENELTTGVTTGSEMFRFSIKYQKDVKNGKCDPGTTYFTCRIPVTVY